MLAQLNDQKKKRVQKIDKKKTQRNIIQERLNPQQLSTFVPETVKFILNKKPEVPHFTQFYSVALFADVSGFTDMSRALARKGSLGTEILASSINAYLAQIVKEVLGAGGDVIKFAGDALVCMWPPSDDIISNEEEQRDPKRVEDTLQRVIQCALDIQENYGEVQLEGAAVRDLNSDTGDEKGIPPLRVKLGIGVGTCGLLVVGGVMGRCEYLVTGEAFAQAFHCEEDCKPKRVVISPKAAELMQTKFKMEAVGKSGNRMVIKRIRKKLARATIAQKTMSEELVVLLKGYIPSAVVPHLLMPSTLWAGELRQVTIMFLSLPFNAKKLEVLDTMLVKHINATIRTLQDMVYLYQGSLNKFLVDDKGSTVMAIFGLPPVAHVNDPERAVLSAMELQLKLSELFTEQYQEEMLKYEEDMKTYEQNPVGVAPIKPQYKTQAAIGITSGVVFLGLVGNAGSRREYTVLGDKVNLAARLMGTAKKKPDVYGHVLCDESIRDSCRSSPFFYFIDRGGAELKGYKTPVPCFNPKQKVFEIQAINDLSEDLLEAGDSHLVSLLSSAVEKMHKEGVGKILFVEGEAGMGKSSLLSLAAKQTETRAWFLWGKGNFYHETQILLNRLAFPVWKQILKGFQTKFPMKNEIQRSSFAQYVGKRRPDLSDWLFLLNDVIELGTPKELEGTPYCLSLKKKLAEAKLKIRFALYDLVLCLLEWAVPRYHPIVIVVDQFQWLREDDWDLTRRLCSHIHAGVLQQVSVFISSQPMDNARYKPHFIPYHLVDEYQKLRSEFVKDNKLIPHAWGEQKTKAFIRNHFNTVQDVAPSLVELVHRQCGGRPGFSKCFVRLLKDHEKEWLEFEDMRQKDEKRLKLKSWHESSSRQHLVRFPIPSEILGVTLRQLDVLSPEQSLCLKTCASLCIAEGYQALRVRESVIRAVHPVEEFKTLTRLRSTLEVLCRMKFIHVDDDDSGSVVNYPVGTQLEGRSTASIIATATATHGSNIVNSAAMRRRNGTSVGGYRTSVFSHSGVGPSSIKHRRWDSAVSNQSANTGNEYAGGEEGRDSSDDDTEIQSRMNHSPRFIDENDGGATLRKNPTRSHIPTKKELFQDPLPGTPYKKGYLKKKKAGLRRDEVRYFIFKERILYWFGDLETDEKPRGHIIFGDNILQLKKLDSLTIAIKHTRKNGKKYVLQGMNKQDRDEVNDWFQLFHEATVRYSSNYHNGETTATVNTDANPNTAAIGSPILQSPNANSVGVNNIKMSPSQQVLTGSHAHNGNTHPPNGYAPTKLGVDQIISEEKSVSGYDRGEAKNLIKTQEELALEEQEEQNAPQGRTPNNNSVNTNPRMSQLVLNEGHTTVPSSATTNAPETEAVAIEEVCYKFSYGFLRDIVYESMLHAQRAKIHKNAEEFFKSIGNEKLRERHRDLGQMISGLNTVMKSDNTNEPRRRRRIPAFIGMG